MYKVFMLLPAFLFWVLCKASANDSCEILFNKQVIFKGKAEQENAVATLKVGGIKNTDITTIIYNSEKPNKGWKRTFYIKDEDEQDLKTIDIDKQKGSVCIKASVLNTIMQKKRPVFIYTASLPKDQSLAARIRVRRILLCKIEWN